MYKQLVTDEDYTLYQRAADNDYKLDLKVEQLFRFKDVTCHLLYVDLRDKFPGDIPHWYLYIDADQTANSPDHESDELAHTDNSQTVKRLRDIETYILSVFKSHKLKLIRSTSGA